mgnify:CR=1 FL=1
MFPINVILFLFDFAIITIVNSLYVLSLPMDTMTKIKQSIAEVRAQKAK